ncbi:hypothetical protein BMR11_16990 [Methylococcaceae bacterium CS5]|nr:hypothetical protein BMR10_16915 [Methylococcaceae bacterium CS4]TXK93414.1 hypothetical protein BMR11_16990 [Methylococcaceae bacterium CS5]
MKKLLFTLLLFLSLNQAGNAGLLGYDLLFITRYQAHEESKIFTVRMPSPEKIIEPGVEFPSNAPYYDFNYGTVDTVMAPEIFVGVNAGNNFIEIDYTDSGKFTSALQNAFVFEFHDHALPVHITSAIIDRSVTTFPLTDNDVQLDGNQLSINVQGLSFNSDSFIRINLDAGDPVDVGNPVYVIGDTGPAGGWVFYVTDGGSHGLEAAPKDLQTATWGCYSTVVGADGVLLHTGKANTRAIISAKCKGAPLYGGSSLVAAKLANDYKYNGYTHWFLPSQDELKLIYSNLFLYDLGDFPIHKEFVSYWSSTELDTRKAYVTHFFGSSDKNYKPRTGTMFKHLVRNVRPIRSF